MSNSWTTSTTFVIRREADSTLLSKDAVNCLSSQKTIRTVGSAMDGEMKVAMMEAMAVATITTDGVVAVEIEETVEATTAVVAEVMEEVVDLTAEEEAVVEETTTTVTKAARATTTAAMTTTGALKEGATIGLNTAAVVTVATTLKTMTAVEEAITQTTHSSMSNVNLSSLLSQALFMSPT